MAHGKHKGEPAPIRPWQPPAPSPDGGGPPTPAPKHV